MDSSHALLIWVMVVSGLISLILILTVGAVLWYHQRRLADQARAWGRHLLTAQDEERQAIARDLHDDVVQRLSGVQLRLNPTSDHGAIALLGEVSRDLRTLARELHPPALSSMSLAEALRDLVALGPEAIAPVITLECDEDVTLPRAETLALYRVAQEALHNMQKHSRAQVATLSLSESAPWVEMQLADNGVGFVASEVEARSFGLRSMKERLALVGGVLTVQSVPGKGTTILARVPLP